jgi:hypothetical protein
VKRGPPFRFKLGCGYLWPKNPNSKRTRFQSDPKRLLGKGGACGRERACGGVILGEWGCPVIHDIGKAFNDNQSQAPKYIELLETAFASNLILNQSNCFEEDTRPLYHPDRTFRRFGMDTAEAQ